jgi:hypothetical protein
MVGSLGDALQGMNHEASQGVKRPLFIRAKQSAADPIIELIDVEDGALVAAL